MCPIADSAEPSVADTPGGFGSGDAANVHSRSLRSALPVVGIFLIALLVRCVYLYEIRAIPFFEHPSVDARAYDAWAQRIAEGDWWGSEVFYQAPAYPYFLGLLHRLGGRGLWWVHGVQMVVGALSCVLVCLAGRRFFGHVAGVIAGSLLALYPPAIFYDGLIQKAGLALFFTALLLYLLGRAQHRTRATTLALCGLVTGLLALTRENALVFVPLVCIWLFVRLGDQAHRRRLACVASFITGAALVLVPVAVRNFSIGGTFAPTTSQMGTNFYIGNNADADGLYAPLVPGRSNPAHERRDAVRLAEQALGRSLRPGDVSNYWLGEGWRFVREQPGDWLRLMLRKWTLVWNCFEVPDAEDIHAYGDWSLLLRTLARPLHFGVLVPLAVAGVVLSWGHRRDLWILYVLLLAMAGSVALFFVFGRYRFPLVPVLVLFAGGACVEGHACWRARRLRPVAVAAVLAALAAVWSNRSILPEAYYSSIAYSNLGAVCARNAQHDDAERYLGIALRMYPQSAPALRHLGTLRIEQGRPAEGHLLLGMAYGQMSEPFAAMEHYRLAIEADPDMLEAHYNLGAVLAHLGGFEQASAVMERALELAQAVGTTDVVERIRDRLERYRAQALEMRRATPTQPAHE